MSEHWSPALRTLLAESRTSKKRDAGLHILSTYSLDTPTNIKWLTAYFQGLSNVTTHIDAFASNLTSSCEYGLFNSVYSIAEGIRCADAVDMFYAEHQLRQLNLPSLAFNAFLFDKSVIFDALSQVYQSPQRVADMKTWIETELDNMLTAHPEPTPDTEQN